MLNFKIGGGAIRKVIRSLLTTDKTVSTAGLYAADAKSVKDLNDGISAVTGEVVSGVTCPIGTITRGEVYKIQQMVIIDVGITVSTATLNGNPILQNLPIPYTPYTNGLGIISGTLYVAAFINKTSGIYINKALAKNDFVDLKIFYIAAS